MEISRVLMALLIFMMHLLKCVEKYSKEGPESVKQGLD